MKHIYFLSDRKVLFLKGQVSNISSWIKIICTGSVSTLNSILKKKANVRNCTPLIFS